MADRLHALLTPDTSANAYQPLSPSAVYLLTQRCYLTIEGPDAIKFLQGQLSCDVQALSQTQAGIGSHSTPQGRMLSSFRINRTAQDKVALGLDVGIRESALAALQKYIVFSKADLQIDSDCHAAGFHGESAKACLEKTLGKLPQTQYQQTQQGGLTITCIDADIPAWEVFGTETDLAAALSDMPKSLISSSTQSTLVEQHAGLAFVSADTAGMFIPQMFNYQATPAISFTKGCYTGQEIVARMKYLGKMKRHMYAAQVTSSTPLKIADYLSISDDAQKQGNITSAVQIGEKRWQVLMILTDNAKAAEILHHSNGALSNIEYMPLPYPVDA